MTKTRYISICSGIEAASTAWHGLGWTPLAFSEIEPFPLAVLAHHYPDVPNLGDMSKFREWSEELLAECDLLVGGTPCQAFSVAGLRKSLGDERGNLSLVYVQLFHHINAIRRKYGRPPAVAVWENVPGVLSTKDNAFGCFISGLLGVDEALDTQDGKWPKAGFLGSETVRVGYRVLDAQYFAVAQRRRRVFLVAVPCELVSSLGERACPSEILSLRNCLLGNPPTRGEAREFAPTIPARSTAGGGLGTDFDCDGGVIASSARAGFFSKEHDGIAKPLGAHALSKGRGTDLDNSTYVAIPYDLFQITAPVNRQSRENGDPCHTLARDNASHAAICFQQNTRDEVRKINGDGQIAGALAAERGAKQQNYIAFAQNQLGEVRTNAEIMGTVNTNQNASGRNTPMVQQAMSVRRLTPRECERLQGFPDDYTLVEYRKKPAADGPRYRALGNSMAVPVMNWVGKRINDALSG